MSVLQDVSWTFNMPDFLQVNPFLVLLLQLLPQEREYTEMENWSEILVDKVVRQYPVAGCHVWLGSTSVCLPHEGQREQLLPSPPSCYYLNPTINRFDVVRHQQYKQDDS